MIDTRAQRSIEFYRGMIRYTDLATRGALGYETVKGYYQRALVHVNALETLPEGVPLFALVRHRAKDKITDKLSRTKIE